MNQSYQQNQHQKSMQKDIDFSEIARKTRLLSSSVNVNQSNIRQLYTIADVISKDIISRSKRISRDVMSFIGDNKISLKEMVIIIIMNDACGFDITSKMYGQVVSKLIDKIS